MKYIQIIAVLLFISVSASAQMKKGKYYAYEVKKGQQFPEIVVITVFDHDSFCRKFIDEKAEKTLDGTYLISENGNSFHIGSFTKGIPNGEWKRYYRGEPEKKTAYVNGKLDGKFYTYAEDGSVYAGEAYKDGIIQHRISRYENGQLCAEVFYDENGKIHGRVVKYNEEGRLIEEENYAHGKKHGKFIDVDEPYETINESEYKNGILVYSKSTFSDGSIKSENVYNEEGKKHGKSIVALSGYISHEETHENGVKKEEKDFFKNGNLRSHKIYDENGEKYAAYYHENPHYMTEEYHYEGGKKHGFSRRYESKDQLRDETFYKYGEDLYRKEYNNGKIKAIYVIDETGRLTKVEEYNSQGKKTYKNDTYKKHPSIRLKEDASGIIDIEIE